MRLSEAFVALWMIGPLVKCMYTIQDMNTLATELMLNYRKTILPNGNFSEQFVVNIQAHPLAVGNIDEVEEQLSTVLGFLITWTDASIKWDPKDHANITQISLGVDEVWKPKLLLQNPHQNYIMGKTDGVTSELVYNNMGETTMTVVLTVHTACNLDMTYFPFDIQNCKIEFMLSNFELSIIVDASWNAFHLKEKMENGVWKIQHSHIEQNETASLEIEFQFKRKPMFMVLNIILPLIMLAFLTPLVFVMPKGSSERLSYSVTMLLAISVFMTIVSDNLPKNSDPMPLISIMIFIWYILNAFIVLLVIMNIKISHIKASRRMPGCIRSFVRLTRRLTLCKNSESLSVSGDENEMCLKQLDNEENENEPRNEQIPVTWRETSHAIDKWCFVLGYILQFAVHGVLLVSSYQS